MTTERERAAKMDAKRDEAPPTLDEILTHCMRVMRTRDGIDAVTEELIRERANNMLAAITGFYSLTPID
jgi:hypothetical protein